MNANSIPKNADRRAFFRRVAVGGLAAVSGTLLVRRANAKCVNEGICGGCYAYDDCGLPRALSVKQVRGESRDR